MATYTRRASGLWTPRQAPPPSVRVGVDWDHPLSAGLIGCYIGSQSDGGVICNLAGYGGDLTPFGTPFLVAGPYGVEAASGISGGAGYGWTAPLPAAMQPANRVSLFWYGGMTANGANTTTPTIFGTRFNNVGASPYIPYGLLRDGTTGNVDLANGDGNNFHSNASPTITLTAGNYYNVVGTIDTTSGTGNKSVMYNSGVAGTTGAAGTATLNYSSTSSLNFGIAPDTPAASSGATLLIGCIWSRVLTAGEAALLAAEPFSMLRPVQPRKYYQAAAPSTNIASGTGAFGALTGAGSASGVNSALEAAAFGSLAASGTAASIDAAAVTGGFGALTASGVLASGQSATATGTFGTLAAAATGTFSDIGHGAAAFGALGSTGAVQATDMAAAAATFGSMSVSGQIALTVNAVAHGVLGGWQGSGIATSTDVAFATGALPALIAASAIAVSNPALGVGAFEADATDALIALTNPASADAPLPGLDAAMTVVSGGFTAQDIFWPPLSGNAALLIHYPALAARIVVPDPPRRILVPLV